MALVFMPEVGSTSRTETHAMTRTTEAGTVATGVGVVVTKLSVAALARWLLGPLLGCVLAGAVVYSVAKGANVVHEAMLPRCTHFEPTPDYMLCHDKWHMVVMTLLEELGWFLAVIAFAVTTAAVVPARKRVVALSCCTIGIAVGAFIAFDVKSVLPVISSLLASAAIMLWASRRYFSVNAAEQPHSANGAPQLIRDVGRRLDVNP
jgi:Kef-type K+ transport system membrane component KefB